MSAQGAWSTPEGAASWEASAAQRQQAMAETTELLLSLAGVGPGSRVLEIGAGTGDVALLVARRVGPTGTVLATDASEAMLEVAARNAREARIANLSTRTARAEDLDLPPSSFDAAVSRNCLMFVNDLPHALRGVRSALRRGGRLAASVWGPPEQNPFHGVPIATVRRRGTIPTPPPEVVQAFSLSDGEKVAAVFRAAGFTGVEVRQARAGRAFASLDEALRTAREFPTFVALLGILAGKERDDAWDEIAREWGRFSAGARIEFPGQQLVVSGQNPG